jgi:hypothetical protein
MRVEVEFQKSGFAWLWSLYGLSAGLYLGFGYQAFWHQGQGPGTGAWLCILSACVLAVWLAGESLARLGQRCLDLPLSQVRTGLAWIGLPLIFLSVGPGLLPFFARAGAHLNLSVLGKLQWPGHAGFVELTPTQYLYLLWAGPWITLPWFLTWGIACRKFIQRLSLGPERRIKKRWLFTTALIFYIVLGFWTSLVYPPTGDEPHYLLMVHSMLHDRDLDLKNNMEHRDYRAFYPGELDFHPAPSPDGKLVSKHFPLFSVLLVPTYAVLGRFGALLVIMATAAALGCLLFQWALAWGVGRIQAMWMWAWVIVSPPLALYFDLVYYELPATLILLYGLWRWLRGGKWGQIALALAAVVLPWIHLKYIPFSCFLGVLLPFTPDTKLRDGWRPALVILLGMAGFYFYFTSLYQFSLSDNPYGQFTTLWSKETLANFLGVWVDRDFGIFTAVPIFFIAWAGVAVKKLPWRAMAALLGVFLVNYGVVGWFEFSGCSAPYSRYMIPGTVFLWLFLPWGWQAIIERWPKSRGWLKLAAAWGVGVAWICAACPVLRYLPPKQKLGAVLGKSFALFPSLASFPAWKEIGWALGWVIALAVVMVYLVRQIKAGKREIGNVIDRSLG